jgi:heat shock protein HslJ
MKGIVGFGFFLLFLAGIAFVTLQGRQMAQQNSQGGGLTGAQWRPISIAGESMPEDSGMSVSFEEDGSIKGHGGCNGFFGSLELKDGELVVGPLGSTRMACPEPIMQREFAFLQAIQNMEEYRASGDSLKILDGAGSLLAQLTKEPS